MTNSISNSCLKDTLIIELKTQAKQAIPYFCNDYQMRKNVGFTYLKCVTGAGIDTGKYVWGNIIGKPVEPMKQAIYFDEL